MKKNYPDMRVLDETDKYFIGHFYEDAYLIEKRNGKEMFHDDFYGDPSCGLIDKNNKWAIIAGEHITIWEKDKLTKIDLDSVRWVHSIRAKANYSKVEILIDPWSENSAIWELNMQTLELKKIRDLDDLD